MNRLRKASILGAFCATMLFGCLEPHRGIAEKERIERQTNIKSETRYGDGRLITVMHDGHLFVLEGKLQKGALLHHPDCPCWKAVNAPRTP